MHFAYWKPCPAFVLEPDPFANLQMQLAVTGKESSAIPSPYPQPYGFPAPAGLKEYSQH